MNKWINPGGYSDVGTVVGGVLEAGLDISAWFP